MRIEKILDGPFSGKVCYIYTFIFTIAGLIAYGLYKKARGKAIGQ